MTCKTCGQYIFTPDDSIKGGKSRWDGVSKEARTAAAKKARSARKPKTNDQALP